jgi:hypothetical protein
VPDPESPPPPQAPPEREPSFVRVASTVFWSFFGVRKRADHDRATSSVRPVHIIVAGLIGGLAFVLGLVLLVRLITSS